MIQWPATLPRLPLAEDYQEGFGDTFLRSPMDAGPAKARKKLSRVPRPVTWPLFLNDNAQMDLFETFYHEDLAGGSLPFAHIHPRTGAPAVLTFRNPPQITKRGLGWMMTLELEILP